MVASPTMIQAILFTVEGRRQEVSQSGGPGLMRGKADSKRKENDVISPGNDFSTGKHCAHIL